MNSLMNLDAAVLSHVSAEPGTALAFIGPGANRLAAQVRDLAGPDSQTLASESGDTGLPEKHCHYVLINADSDRDRKVLLEEAARILRHDGRLVWLEGSRDLRTAVVEVENEGWTVQRTNQLDEQLFILELTKTDESVQS